MDKIQLLEIIFLIYGLSVLAKFKLKNECGIRDPRVWFRRNRH